MTTPYTKSHPLRWPAAGLTEVTVSTVPLTEIRKLRAKFHMDDPDKTKRDFHGFDVAVFKIHTGLSDDQRGAIKQPDLNSITQIIADLVLKPSYELVPSQAPADPDTFPLLVPVIDVMRGQDHITLLKMAPPTVRMTDVVRQLGEFERERELVAVCTEILPNTVDQLHMPDWVALQRRVSDFLDETADYFPPQTSNV